MISTCHHISLVVCLILFGTVTSLLLKWANFSPSHGSSQYENPRYFRHPFVQSVVLFIGQSLCFPIHWLIVVFCSENSEARKIPVCKWFLFLPPAILNIIGSSVMYVGLNFSYPNNYQLLRGTVIVFTGLMSVAFVGRSIRFHMWVGIAVLTVGLIVSGLSEAFFAVNRTAADTNGIVAGDLLIILSHIILSAQYVYEEKYVKIHNIPASLAVGLEGLFGGVILGSLLVPMWYIPASKPFSINPGHLEDVWDALIQIKHNWQIAVATAGLVVSSAVVSYCGVKVTKEMSATTRQVVISGRCVLIWIMTLALRWEPFEFKSFWLHLSGFSMLVVGILIYHDLVFRPFLIHMHCLQNKRHPGLADDRNGYGFDESDDDQQHLIHNRNR